MKQFIEGEDRSLSTLFPEHLDDYVAEDNPVRVYGCLRRSTGFLCGRGILEGLPLS
jgi:hypothetical protein